MQGFEFEAKSLDYGTIESEICRYYDLGYPNSSNFMEITTGIGQTIFIDAVNGSIRCRVSAYQKKDSEQFLVSVSGAEIKKNR